MEAQSLESRIESLERQNRLFRRGSMALAALAITSIAVAFGSAGDLPDAHYRIVSASKFSLVDQRTGKPRAELSHQTMAGGWAGITLWDEAGRPRAEFKLWEDGRTVLNSLSAEGKPQWDLSTEPDGKTRMQVGGHEVVTR